MASMKSNSDHRDDFVAIFCLAIGVPMVFLGAGWIACNSESDPPCHDLTLPRMNRTSIQCDHPDQRAKWNEHESTVICACPEEKR